MGLKLEFETDRGLLYIDVLASILVFTIFFAPWLGVLRIILGIPFILFFPGYALTSALFPRKKDLDSIERLALSFGLSLAVVPLIGLILNYTPFGIRLYPVTLSLFLFMLGMTAIERMRFKNIPPKDRFTLKFSVYLPSWSEMNLKTKLMALGCVVAVVGAGFGISYLASMPRYGERFTEFYILGPEGKMANYPTNLKVGERGIVILGIKNHEYKDENYSVIIALDNETLEEIRGIELSHGETWEKEIAFQVSRAGERMKLEFLLYRYGDTEPYRKLHLWLNVRE